MERIDEIKYHNDTKELDALLKSKSIEEMNQEELEKLSLLTNSIERFENILFQEYP